MWILACRVQVVAAWGVELPLLDGHGPAHVQPVRVKHVIKAINGFKVGRVACKQA